MSRLLRRGLRPPAVPHHHRRRGGRGRRRRTAALRHGQGLGRPDAQQRRRKRPSRDSTTCSPTNRKKSSASTGTTRASDNGLLRTHVSNNWQITKPNILSDFYTKKQQDVIHDVWKGIINPEWYDRFLKQLKDDTGGAEWGEQQSIAIFGKPGGEGKFEFVMTGRHMTLRADGHSQDHVAFGGPIFYGHAASGFNEKVHHPGNVFWPQAVEANKVYGMLDPKQQAVALIEKRPKEAAVGFQGDKGAFPGIPVKELAGEQKKEMQKILSMLIEPFRKDDQEEAMACLKQQGGLDHCSLAFYKEGDIGDDGEWDNWRLEGPSFVWYFRGQPHVHVWVNVADDPSIPTNAKG